MAPRRHLGSSSPAILRRAPTTRVSLVSSLNLVDTRVRVILLSASPSCPSLMSRRTASARRRCAIVTGHPISRHQYENIRISVGGVRVPGVAESDLRLDPSTSRGGVVER